MNEDPFWSLVKLVQENNSIVKLKEALSVKDDTIGFEYTPEMAKVDAHEIARLDINEDEEESESDDSSDSDGESSFTCPYCENKFADKATILIHMDDCMK